MFIYFKWKDPDLIAERMAIGKYSALLEIDCPIGEVLKVLSDIDDTKMKSIIEPYKNMKPYGCVIEYGIADALDQCIELPGQWIARGYDIRDYIVDKIGSYDLAVLRSKVYQITIDMFNSDGVQIKGDLYDEY